MEKYLVDLFVTSAQDKSRVPGWLIRLYLSLFGVPLGKTIRIDMVKELIRGYEIKGKRILDVGCGAGDLSLMLTQQGAEVIGVELDAQKVASANRTARQWNFDRVRFIAGDVMKLQQMGLGQFDMIFCLALLEHIKDDAGLISQMKSMLRPNGQFIMEVPNARRKTIPAVEAEDGHVRPGYIYEDVPDFLKGLGFHVKENAPEIHLAFSTIGADYLGLIPGPKGRGQLFAVLAPIFIFSIRLTSLWIKRTGYELGFLAVNQEK